MPLPRSDGFYGRQFWVSQLCDGGAYLPLRRCLTIAALRGGQLPIRRLFCGRWNGWPACASRNRTPAAILRVSHLSRYTVLHTLHRLWTLSPHVIPTYVMNDNEFTHMLLSLFLVCISQRFLSVLIIRLEVWPRSLTFYHILAPMTFGCRWNLVKQRHNWRSVV